jgi:iron complex outermembrane receptor protein
VVDGLVEFALDRGTLSIRASNLLDKRYFASCRVYGGWFTGNRRNVIATPKYRF